MCAGLVLLFEAGTQLLGIHFPAITRPEQQHGGLWTYDRSKGWFHKPEARSSSPLGGPDHAEIRTNSLGLRGAEVAATKPDGVKRILVFGDQREPERRWDFGTDAHWNVDATRLVASVLANYLRQQGLVPAAEAPTP